MDFIKLDVSNYATGATSGQIINNTTSTLWVERYQDAGEFEIVAPLSAGLKDFLPTGTLISHMDTREVMIVENHEIKDNTNGMPETVTTGRSMEILLERRPPALKQHWSIGTTPSKYTVPAGSYSDKAMTVIADSLDKLPVAGLVVTKGTVGDAGESYPFEEVSINADGYSVLQNQLNLGKFGIKTTRETGGAGDWYTWTVHGGVDKSESVAFTHGADEIVSANYLFSNKTFADSAFMFSTWTSTFVISYSNPLGNYGQSMVVIDCTDLDEHHETLPTSGERTTLRADMVTRANKQLAANNHTVISNVEIAQNTLRHKYRRDYNIGDIVGVSGDYNASTTMRVTEYVEIEDETGEKNYPTLSAIEQTP